MTDHESYPDSLFCMVCNQDVDTVIREVSGEVSNNDGTEKVSFSYLIAECPVCRSVLCSRDYDRQFAKALARKMNQ